MVYSWFLRWNSENISDEIKKNVFFLLLFCLHHYLPSAQSASPPSPPSGAKSLTAELWRSWTNLSVTSHLPIDFSIVRVWSPLMHFLSRQALWDTLSPLFCYGTISVRLWPPTKKIIIIIHILRARAENGIQSCFARRRWRRHATSGVEKSSSLTGRDNSGREMSSGSTARGRDVHDLLSAITQHTYLTYTAL